MKALQKFNVRRSVFLVIVAAALGVFVFLWAEHQRELARHLEKLRQQQITKSLATLRKSFPNRVFSACNTDKIPVAFRANFHEAGVRSVTLSRLNDEVAVSVGLLGIKQENQAPTIYVTLYDERGTVLARSPVVNYTLALLDYGTATEVEDKMTLPKGADPVIVSVDDPKQYKIPWGADG